MGGPGDEIASGRGPLWASRADRERVIDILKAAFVDERLTKDEFDLRVGQVLASRTYADLDALTSDLPATPATLTALLAPAPAPELRSEPDPRKLIVRGSARVGGASFVLTEAVMLLHSPVLGLVAAAFVGCFVAVLTAGLLTFLAWL
jgi:hypothetical protein